MLMLVSSLMSVDCNGIGVTYVTLEVIGSDGICRFLLSRVAYMWTITIAFEFGGYMRNLLVVSVGNVTRKPNLIACLRVAMVGENTDAW